MKRLKGLAISWFFAPYVGSADIDFFKRIKDTDIDYTVLQVARKGRDDEVLKHATHAGISRVEVQTDYNNPRGRIARDEFRDACLYHYKVNAVEYDFIISHSNEIPSHAVALEIKRLNPKLPWIAYFGDLFRDNPYIRHMPGYPLVDEDTKTELDAIRNADVVILNNDYQKQLMFKGDMAAYAHKAVVIPHCYDKNMYPRERKDERSEAPIRFAHLGTLYHVKRTAEPVLRAVDRLLSIYPAYRRRFEVVFYGSSVSSHDISVHAFMKNRNHVIFEDGVSYMQSLALMKDADVLLLIDGIFDEQEDDLGFNPFLAGKLMDYMGAQRPIMAVTMPKGPSADILTASRNILANQNIDRIAYTMKRYIDGKIVPDYNAYAAYECEKIAPMMEAAIRGAMMKGKISEAV